MVSDNKLATVQHDGAAVMDAVISKGDISKLSPAERVQYYNATCNSLGLNPLTQPFQYLTLSGKTVLYAGRTATDQLRKIHGVSIDVVSKERIEDVYVVTVKAWTPDGRQDVEIGAVPIGSMKGEALANALMKAETKAKRRATLSICGLGWMDESEVETVRDARPVNVDMTTGEILDHEPVKPAPKPKPVKVVAEVQAAPTITKEEFQDYAKANGITSTGMYLDVVKVPVPADPAEAYRLLKERLDLIEAEQSEQAKLMDMPVDPAQYTA